MSNGLFLVMAKKVSISGELERKAYAYGLPLDGAGRLIVQLPLVWAWVDSRLQVVIDMPGVWYPNLVLASRTELLALMGEEGAV